MENPVLREYAWEVFRGVQCPQSYCQGCPGWLINKPRC